MSVVTEAAAELAAAIATVEGIRVYTRAGATVDPPAVVIGPPTLTWETTCTDPNESAFPVAVVVAAGDRAMDRLWDLVPLVAAAIESVPGAVVRTATPGSFAVGASDLPSYEIAVEMSL